MEGWRWIATTCGEPPLRTKVTDTIEPGSPGSLVLASEIVATALPSICTS